MIGDHKCALLVTPILGPPVFGRIPEHVALGVAAHFANNAFEIRIESDAGDVWTWTPSGTQFMAALCGLGGFL